MVLAVDPLGIGETKQTAARGLMDGYTSVLIGRSVVGIQAGDITRAASFLRSLEYVNAEKIGAVGFDNLCIPLIHATSFDSSIKNVVLIGSLASYASVAMNKFYKIGLTSTNNGSVEHPYEVNFSWGVAGVLHAYDLPDLIAAIAPRKVVMVDTKDQMNEMLSEAELKEQLGYPLSVFEKKAPQKLKLITAKKDLLSLVEELDIF